MKAFSGPLIVQLFVLTAYGCGGGESVGQPSAQAVRAADQMPNNHPIQNPGGHAASFSTEGSIVLDNEFHTPQGSNGRSCGTCHAPEDGWSIRPETAQRWFDETDGLHPLFSILDANTPFSDLSTVDARRQSYSMLLQGKFLRLRRAPSSREYDVIAASDPFGFGSTELLLFFRRPLPTANFRSHTVMWDAANTVGTSLRDGLVRQARSNVIGAQLGLPAPDAIIFAIVDHELSVSHAQLMVPGVGRLDAGGAKGGPEAQSSQPLVAGRFDLYDAWIGHPQPKRAQIARGQELFNNVNPASGRTCRGCHSAANNGQHVGGALFDIGTSSPAHRKPDMAIYTLQKRGTGEIKETTDWGRGGATGLWSDVNRFKTPNLRGLAARAPYFHNGIADTLMDVVEFYEASLGFVFTPEEEADLVAFMNAL